MASPALAKDAPAVARAAALAALVALVAGPYLAVERPSVGRAVGVYAFVALCSITWLLLGAELSVDRLEPVQAGLGALGWAAFVFGWGSLRQPGAIPEDHPNVLTGAPLHPRSGLPQGAVPVLGISIVGAIVCLGMAWRVARPDHALLAHSAAIVCAIAILSVGAQVAILRGGRRQRYEPARRIVAARRALLFLAVLVVGGIFWQIAH